MTSRILKLVALVAVLNMIGLVMILFLVFEPLGLVGIWHRIQTYFLLWPFKHRPVAGARK